MPVSLSGTGNHIKRSAGRDNHDKTKTNMKIQHLLFLALLAAMLGRDDAVAQTTATTTPVGLYQFPFLPGTDLVGQTESNGMSWAAAGPIGPQITIASNSLAVPGLASPA